MLTLSVLEVEVEFIIAQHLEYIKVLCEARVSNLKGVKCNRTTTKKGKRKKKKGKRQDKETI